MSELRKRLIKITKGVIQNAIDGLERDIYKEFEEIRGEKLGNELIKAAKKGKDNYCYIFNIKKYSLLRDSCLLELEQKLNKELFDTNYELTPYTVTITNTETPTGREDSTRVKVWFYWK